MAWSHQVALRTLRCCPASHSSSDILRANSSRCCAYYTHRQSLCTHSHHLWDVFEYHFVISSSRNTDLIPPTLHTINLTNKRLLPPPKRNNLIPIVPIPRAGRVIIPKPGAPTRAAIQPHDLADRDEAEVFFFLRWFGLLRSYPPVEILVDELADFPHRWHGACDETRVGLDVRPDYGAPAVNCL